MSNAKRALLGALCGCLLLAACQNGQRNGEMNGDAGQAAYSAERWEHDSAVLWVRGLSCPLCAHNIDQQLKRVPGVLTVNVDLGTGKVVTTFEKNRPSAAELAAAVDAAGFTLARIEPPSYAKEEPPE
jgi:copper chaperone CopZ